MNKENILKSIFGAILFCSFALPTSAGQLSFGLQYDGWNSNYLITQTGASTNQGYEFWLPFALNLNLDKGIQVYGQGTLANGSYTFPPDTAGDNSTVNLTNLTDTVVGGEFQFKSLGLSSLVNVSLNLPTGDPTWESKQIVAMIPTEFLDYRYRGRGFGFNALYGVSIPAGKNSFGVGAGYLHSGTFDPTGDPAGALQLGDNLFIALNFIQNGTNDYREIARFSGYYSLTTQIDGVDQFQMGTNLNASYSWINPHGFSLDAGGQYFYASRRLEGLNLTTEPYNYYGPRLYLAPSYALGDVKISGQAKYVFANDYPEFSNGAANTMYFGGGWLFGVGPSWKATLDDKSSLNIFGAYDFISQNNVPVVPSDPSQGNTRAYFNYWTIGTSYQITL